MGKKIIVKGADFSINGMKEEKFDGTFIKSAKGISLRTEDVFGYSFYKTSTNTTSCACLLANMPEGTELEVTINAGSKSVYCFYSDDSSEIENIQLINIASWDITGAGWSDNRINPTKPSMIDKPQQIDIVSKVFRVTVPKDAKWLVATIDQINELVTISAKVVEV